MGIEIVGWKMSFCSEDCICNKFLGFHYEWLISLPEVAEEFLCKTSFLFFLRSFLAARRYRATSKHRLFLCWPVSRVLHVGKYKSRLSATRLAGGWLAREGRSGQGGGVGLGDLRPRERSSNNKLAARDVPAAWVWWADHLDTRAAAVGARSEGAAGTGSGFGERADEVRCFIAPCASSGIFCFATVLD